MIWLFFSVLRKFVEIFVVNLQRITVWFTCDL